MTKKNLPNIPLYIGDWEKDCNVLSLKAEAAWLRIIFKMFTNGKQSTYKIPTKGLQNLWRCNEEDVNHILMEFQDYNICEVIKNGRFVEFTSRRFEKENEISQIRKKAVSKRKDREKDLQNGYKKPTKHIQITDIENENESENVNKDDNVQINQYDEILKIFNSLNHNFPKIKKITDARKKAINARIKDHSLELIGEVFTLATNSNFLNGKGANGWVANFDWIMSPTNFNKILEGNYENRESNTNNNTGPSDKYRRDLAERLGIVKS